MLLKCLLQFPSHHQSITSGFSDNVTGERKLYLNYASKQSEFSPRSSLVTESIAVSQNSVWRQRDSNQFVWVS